LHNNREFIANNQLTLNIKYTAMTFELPKLNYADDALEPVISKQTIGFHYSKHHQTYVTNLNNLLQGTKFESSTLEAIIKEADGVIFNNAAQVWNHTFYFNSFKSKASRVPNGKLNNAINNEFGSFSAFKELFNKAAITLFGSGWAWLVKNQSGKLEIIQESNAGNPLRKGFTPILTFDVWEHAYYLDYQNRRTDYVNALWDIVDWDVVEKRF
jgi:superoxide dismutase, Fe-Mn family